jgi:hypothetical protein
MENNNLYQQTSSNNLSKIIPLAFLVVIAVFSLLTFLKISSTTATISVTGKSEILAKPDSVKFIVTRINTGVDVSATIDDGTNGINKLIAVAKELGGKDIEIKQTIYQTTNTGTVYSVANGFSIKTTNLDKIDNFIKNLYINGATSVSSVTFESNDIKNVDEKLRFQVYADAKDKANRIAKSASKRLGRVVSIVDDDTTIASTVEDLGNTDGLINISKSASVIYKIW